MLNQTMIDYFRDLRKFFNKREVPATKIMELIGRVTPSSVPSGMTLIPHNKRVSKIVVRVDLRNQDLIKLISFDHADAPIGLDELWAEFGRYKAEYFADDNSTMLTAMEFPEEEVILKVVHRIEGYQFKNAEDDGGLILVQDGQEVYVRLSDMQLPTTGIFFKDVERPKDPKAKPRQQGGLLPFLR